MKTKTKNSRAEYILILCIIYIDFNFEAVVNRNSKWVIKYDSIKKGITSPLFFLFPSLDTTFLWMFPKRKLLHQHLDEFLEMLDDVIKHKRSQIESGNNKNDALEDNEKDLLSLMIESEEEGGKMTDKELKVSATHTRQDDSHACNINLLSSYITFFRVIYVSFSWLDMTQLPVL